MKTMIANIALLVRRLGEVRRQRQAIVDRQERLRGGLPEWAREPLRLMGLTAAEVAGFLGERYVADQETMFDELAHELEGLDQQIDELEDRLVTMPYSSLEKVQAVLDLGATRLRSQTATDPDDASYDHGEARVLVFVDAAAEHLRSLLAADYRLAS